MRVTVIIASHNEGDLLRRTLASCLETTGGLDCEIVVADDASTDGSIDALRRDFPGVRVVAHASRRGCSATKDLGARNAAGDVLVFVDGHCKPERWAIERLVNDVEDLGGNAIVTPCVPALDAETWENSERAIGYGYRMDLLELACGWMHRSQMRKRDRLYESPALIGCCLAVSRELYDRLQGFDPDMVDWGVEDLDFGLKAWLMGGAVLLDRWAAIGHRFRSSFDNFSVAGEAVSVNQLRLARKHFTEPAWEEWRERFRGRHSAEDWDRAWERFSGGRESAEREREYLHAHRVRDEYWYAERFGLEWPRSCS